MRESSERSVRIQVAFGGGSTPEELLDREDEGELVDLEREVVDPLRVRDRLPPRLLLHVLLEARVEVADDGLDALDPFAVQLHDEAEDAVRGGVVRPEVDLEDVAFLAESRVDLQDRRDRARDPGAGVDRQPSASR